MVLSLLPQVLGPIIGLFGHRATPDFNLEQLTDLYNKNLNYRNVATGCYLACNPSDKVVGLYGCVHAADWEEIIVHKAPTPIGFNTPGPNGPLLVYLEPRVCGGFFTIQPDGFLKAEQGQGTIFAVLRTNAGKLIFIDPVSRSFLGVSPSFGDQDKRAAMLKINSQDPNAVSLVSWQTAW